MYGYSFGAAELKGTFLKLVLKYRVFHYGLEFKVGNWSFDKANGRSVDLINSCRATFPDPPDPSEADQRNDQLHQHDLLSIENTLNEALLLHHARRKCSDRNSQEPPQLEAVNEDKLIILWMIFLWASVLGFAVVMTVVLRRRKGRKKGKGSKSRKRSLNDQDNRTARATEAV